MLPSCNGSTRQSSRATILVVALVVVASSGIWTTTTTAFTTSPVSTTATSSAAGGQTTETTLFLAKSRKARRMQTQKVDKSRPQSFYDAINDSNDIPVDKKKKKKSRKSGAVATDTPPQEGEDEESLRDQRLREAQERMDARPEVSTMITDEETGIQVVAQGKSVMDVVTRKAVVLSALGPEYRLAQMFPGVPPAIRDKYRVDWKTINVLDLVEKLREACSVKGEIPTHPSVANKAIDFVLANRDYMSYKMKRTLGRLTMSAQSKGNKEQAEKNQALWKNFLTLENHISAPFRQMLMDAEGRVGPNFGNLDIKSFCDGELYERAANYLVLKGMVAHWEKKVVDADYIEKTPQTKENYMTVLSRGDPKRYLPDPPILFTLKECTQVCYMSQQMTQAFVETPELFNDLPPELRFMEKALTIKGGTPLRKFMIEEFCPAEEITPEGLREGLRRLYAQLENMQIDPYADICNILDPLIKAVSVGTDDERDPYLVVLANRDRNGPGAFQTYTFDHEQLSLVRFLDGQYERGSSAPVPKAPAASGGLGGFFNFGAPQPEREEKAVPSDRSEGKYYKVPEARAAGRPHELGWLNLVGEQDEKEKMQFGKVPAGRIIPDDE